MEFRCRVATADGQIMEAIYVAESEARLRLELEEKGLYLLSVQPAGVSSSGSLRLGLPHAGAISDARVPRSSTRSWRRCSRPACRSCSRSTSCAGASPNPVFKAALDDVYEKVRAGTALSEAFEAQELFSGVYTASLMAGEKSGNLEQVLRRYVQHIKVLAPSGRKSISALIYPAVLVALSVVVVGIIVFKVVPEFADFYAQFGQARAAALDARRRGDLDERWSAAPG